MNRASDSGSEGRAFESHRGHNTKSANVIAKDICAFCISIVVQQMHNQSFITLSSLTFAKIFFVDKIAN